MKSMTTPDWPTILSLGAFHLIALLGIFFVSWPAFYVFLALYFLTASGITLGFHRYFTHRSFKTYKWIEYVFAIMGTLALQGSIAMWVAHHRIHHAHSDTDGDPHDANRGFWYSHILWLFFYDAKFDDPKVIKAFSKDIHRDPFLALLCRPAVFIGMQVALGIVLWATLGFEVMIWGIFVRLVAVYHATWFVNSATHKWGYKNYQLDKDLATNVWWVGVLALGEGWHNNHHAHPKLAKHGHKWWEFDITYVSIWLLRKLGLAWDVQLPSREAEAKPVSGSLVYMRAAGE
jgi:stearoyl-CoA desaturase (delta-9 desaturase)